MDKEDKLLFKDENARENEICLKANLRAAYISVAIMTVLIVFNFFSALSPFELELIAVILASVYLFVYVKFSIVCTELKDLGYKSIWVTLCRTVGLALYLISAVLCMLGIG